MEEANLNESLPEPAHQHFEILFVRSLHTSPFETSCRPRTTAVTFRIIYLLCPSFLSSLPLSTSIFCNLIELKQMKSNIPLHIGHSQLCVADIVQKLGYRVQGKGHRATGQVGKRCGARV